MSKVPAEDDYAHDMSKVTRKFVSNPTGTGLLMSLVVLRQLYHLVALKADEVIDAQCGEDAAGVSEMFFLTVGDKSKRDFNVDDVAKNWEHLKTVLDSFVAGLKQTKKEIDEEDAKDAQRKRSGPLPLGVAWNADGETEVTDRSKSITLVGPRSAVKSVMRKMATTLVEAKFPIAYLTNDDPRLITEIKAGPDLVVSPWEDWRESGKSAGTFTAFMKKHVLGSLESLFPSVVFIENMGLAAPPLYIGQPFELIAAAAHRHINRACFQSMEAMLVHAICWDDGELPASVPEEKDLDAYLAGPMFTQFRSFSRLLRVLEDGGIEIKGLSGVSIDGDGSNLGGVQDGPGSDTGGAEGADAKV